MAEYRMTLEGDDFEVEVEIEYAYIPGEEASFDSPGCYEEIEVEEIRFVEGGDEVPEIYVFGKRYPWAQDFREVEVAILQSLRDDAAESEYERFLDRVEGWR